MHGVASLQETTHILDQIHGGLDTELTKYLVVKKSLFSHTVPGRRTNLSCILMLYKDEEPDGLSSLFKVTPDISS